MGRQVSRHASKRGQTEEQTGEQTGKQISGQTDGQTKHFDKRSLLRANYRIYAASDNFEKKSKESVRFL